MLAGRLGGQAFGALIVWLVFWFGSGGSFGRTVRASVVQSVVWLLDGELVGVFVGKLIGVWVGSLVYWSVDGLTGRWLIAQWVNWWFGRFVRRWDTDFCVGVSVVRWGGWSDAGWAPEEV